jgi:hypothetical protein
MDIETVYNEIVESITNEVENDIPDFTIENDGIGFYDFGDVRKFDKGEDYYHIENDEREIFVFIPNASLQLLNDVVSYTNQEKFYVLSSNNEEIVNIQYYISEMKLARKNWIVVTVKFQI